LFLIKLIGDVCMSADYNKNDLEFRAKYLLKTKIKGKDKINLDILKGNIHEINYLVREGYLVEKGDTVGSFHYELTNKGNCFISICKKFK